MGIRDVSSPLSAGANAILHTKVRLALLDVLGADALRMEIDVDDGNVSLAGRVRARASRELAGEVARRVRGVKDVKSDIRTVMEVRDCAGPFDDAKREVSDRTLEAKVRLRLLEEIGASALRVGIDAADGAVALSCDTDDRDLLARAEETAKRIEGVNRVTHGGEVRG